MDIRGTKTQENLLRAFNVESEAKNKYEIYAAKAKKDGDAPDIVKDEITKVTLFDYSDIFTDDEDDDEDYYEDED